jgi:hypothetical protein
VHGSVHGTQRDRLRPRRRRRSEKTLRRRPYGAGLPRSARWPETARDGRDTCRMAHNPEVAGSNSAPATRQNGPGSITSGPFSATCDRAPGHIRVRSLGASPEMPQVPTVFSLVPLRSARSGPCPSSRTMMRRRPCRCGGVSVPSVLHPSAWAMACCPLAWPTRIRALGARGFSLAGCWL